MRNFFIIAALAALMSGIMPAPSFAHDNHRGQGWKHGHYYDNGHRHGWPKKRVVYRNYYRPYYVAPRPVAVVPQPYYVAPYPGYVKPFFSININR